MNLLFLQNFGLDPGVSGGNPLIGGNSSLAGLGGLSFGILVLYILVILVAYFYFSLAFMNIGKKANLANPGVAWLSPVVTIFETAKMHWWPFPFMIVGILLGELIMFGGMLSGSLITAGIFALIGGLVLFITIIVFIIMVLIWLWKTFEAIGRPGWWAIISPIISIIGFLFLFAGVFTLTIMLVIIGVILLIIAAIVFAVLVGIAAWGK